MTRCEETAGHPALLRDMVTFLGFRWAPEYQVFEHQKEFFQTVYRAVVYIASDDGRRVVRSFAAMGPSIDMAVQQVAYVALTMLRGDYYGFNDSRFRHISRGYLTDDVAHFTLYDHLDVYERDPTRLDVTAKFAWHSDVMTQGLTQELATVKGQLREALTRLATHTPEFVQERRFAAFQLPCHTPLPDAGGYEPVRGPLLNLGVGYS